MQLREPVFFVVVHFFLLALLGIAGLTFGFDLLAASYSLLCVLWCGSSLGGSRLLSFAVIVGSSLFLGTLRLVGFRFLGFSGGIFQPGGAFVFIVVTVVLADELFQLLHQPHANHAPNLGFVSMLGLSRGVTNRIRCGKIAFCGKNKIRPQKDGHVKKIDR